MRAPGHSFILLWTRTRAVESSSMKKLLAKMHENYKEYKRNICADIGERNIIGQGPGNNYLVHETGIITVNANGATTTDIDNISIEYQ